ncbi:MAG: hypothetical protein JXB04_02590 [Kiritimatiellae bacterium]|nr:hypothetical protein [Kiritimatiellia bacterium]
MSGGNKHDDWRWLGTTLAAPYNNGTRIRPQGEIVRIMIPVRAFDRDISLPLPSVPATFLHLTFERWSRAQHIRQQMELQADDLAKAPALIADFFESIMSSIVFAYASLEAFANLLIPADAKWTEKKKRRGIFCVRLKPTIERHESTAEKIGTILPALLSFQSPKGTTTWDQFLVLQKARDSVVHFKTDDQTPEVQTQHLWSTWIQDSCPQYPEIAYQMLNFVCSRIKEPPLWFKQLKQEREPSPSADE